MAGDLLGKDSKGRRTPAGWQGVRASWEKGDGGHRGIFHGSRREDGRDHHDGGIHLAVDEHGDGALVTGLVGVGMQQFMQPGAGHHGIQQQDQRHQQRGDQRVGMGFEIWISRLQTDRV